MTNAWKIKEAIKQDIDSMTIEQLFAFCNLFEDARQYGISLTMTRFTHVPAAGESVMDVFGRKMRMQRMCVLSCLRNIRNLKSDAEK